MTATCLFDLSWNVPAHVGKQGAASLRVRCPQWTIILVYALLFGAGGALVAGDVPVESPLRTLRHGDTVVTVVMPDALHGYYRGPRFDWGGMVTQASWQGHTLFTELKTPHDPVKHDHASGACEEFSLDGVPGYADTVVGGRFMKIGVGALVRDTDKPYFFGHQYPIAVPGEWVVREGADSLTFTQEFTLDGDHAYGYVKSVAVIPDGFRIARQLTNRGAQRFVTDHYCHNMMAIDGQPIDGTWSLAFAWDVTAKAPSPLFTMTGRALSLTAPLTRTLWTPIIWDATPATTAFTVTHGASGISTTVTIDAPPSAFRLYGESRALCPEPFVQVDLAPGAQMSWSTTYRFTSAAK